MSQSGFFDVDERLAALSAAGDPLVRLSKVVNFELFGAVLDKALNRSDRSQGGRPPYDAVLVFKGLVLQSLYSRADDAVEFQVRDRLSFMRFRGLGLGDKVPDAKTVWLFREQLVQAKVMEPLFTRFDEALHAAGYLAMGGQVIDATVVAAPRQKLSDDEKAKRRQKDTDARWAIKRGRCKRSEASEMEASEMKAPGAEIAVPIFDYKNHAGVDRCFGFIRRWCTTSAAAHDSRPFEGLLDPNNTGAKVWAGTAYRSKRNEAAMRKRRLISQAPGQAFSAASRPCQRGAIAGGSAVEQVFAEQKHRMKLFVRMISTARATVKIGMANLDYNFQRLAWLEARAVPA
jgi:IS5 family transposase